MTASIYSDADYVPYTYFLKWTNLNKKYYGVRYSKKQNANPKDLWNPYKTSSDYVKTFILENGDPDIIQVMEVFPDDPIGAQVWEELMLQRMGVRKDPDWLNMNDKKSFPYYAGENHPCWGSHLSEYTKNLISEKRRLFFQNLSEEEREVFAQMSKDAGVKGAKKISAKAKERFADPEFIQKHITAHNTPEYIEKLSKAVTLAFQKEDVKQRHLDSVNTLEYKSTQSKNSKENWANKDRLKQMIDTLKNTLSTPEHRQLMSDRDKASTEKRLETRRRNNLLKEHS